LPPVRAVPRRPWTPGSKVDVKVMRGGEVFAIEAELALLEQ
jgi:hypothetical protein